MRRTETDKGRMECGTSRAHGARSESTNCLLSVNVHIVYYKICAMSNQPWITYSYAWFFNIYNCKMVKLYFAMKQFYCC